MATWDAHPQIKKELYNDSDDGLFYMAFEDFCQYFTEIEVLLKNMKE